MFINSKLIAAMELAEQSIDQQEDQELSPRYEAPLAVREPDGSWLRRPGVLGLLGCSFSLGRRPQLGEYLLIRLSLVGMGTKVLVLGQVVRTKVEEARTLVAVRFVELPFDTERLVARWLDLMNLAYKAAAA